MLLAEFLEKKPLYYTEIDYTRMPRVYEKIKTHFTPTKIVHIIGTNGKGTTGRFLAGALHNLGYKTAHYTSPHILKFNERIWLNGQNVSDETLESTHIKLQSILSKEDSQSLSYFEYTTFLAMLVFDGCEYIVLEAGLGGEYDATAVFPKTLTLVTPIAYDHESFLGTSIEAIATTKLNAIQNKAILGKQIIATVYDIAEKIAHSKGLDIYDVQDFIIQEDEEKIQIISKELSLVEYLQSNLRLSIACLNYLKISYSPENFHNTKLFGRMTQFRENIILDVGHNPLAASSLLQALKAQKYILIYNTYKDKEYKKILQILKPIVKSVAILEVPNQRIEAQESLQRTLTDLEIKYETFQSIQSEEKYLVFGSFSVVEEFLRVYSE